MRNLEWRNLVQIKFGTHSKITRKILVQNSPTVAQQAWTVNGGCYISCGPLVSSHFWEASGCWMLAGSHKHTTAAPTRLLQGP